MKPGQIQVFDGLRLTTEHVNHLQEALRSGVEDLREILGLGMVHSGFEVTPAGSGAVTVQPGLAFDFQRNRLISDESKTVQIAFDPGTDTQYVCLKYLQVEDGKVEGTFTLLYDSCSLVTRPTLPDPKENLVAIAKVTERGGDLTIAELNRPAKADHADSGDAHGAGGNGAGEASADGSGAGASASQAPKAPSAAAGGAPATESPTPPPASASAAPAETSGAPTAAPPRAGTAPAGSPAVRQGVQHLAGDPAGFDLSTALAGPLRNALAAGNRPNTELRLGLFESNIPLDFAILSLTSQAALSASLQLDPVGSTTSPSPSGGAPPADGSSQAPAPKAGGTTFHIQAAAHGEATFNQDGAVAQFGLSTVQISAGDTATPTWSPGLSEGAIVHLPLVGSPTAGVTSGVIEAALQHVQLLIRVDRDSSGALKLIGNLQWIGETSDDMIGAIQTHKPILTWDGFLGWKVFGTEHVSATTT